MLHYSEYLKLLHRKVTSNPDAISEENHNVKF